MIDYCVFFFIQFCSFIDEIFVFFGGKNNYWRRLNFSNIFRIMMMYDIVDYVEFGVILDRL